MINKPFEIPEMMREATERNVEQARDAYEKFVEAAHNAQSVVEKSSGAVATGTKDVQALTMKFAEQNIAASFSFASALANSKNLQEALQIQQKFAADQIKNYTSQTQALGKAVAKASDKAKPKN